MTSQDQLLVVIFLWIMAPLLFVVLLAAPLSLLPVLVRGKRAMRKRIETVRQARLWRQGGPSAEQPEPVGNPKSNPRGA